MRLHVNIYDIHSDYGNNVGSYINIITRLLL